MLWICIVSIWEHLLGVAKLMKMVFAVLFMHGGGMDQGTVMIFLMLNESQIKPRPEAGTLMKKMERFIFGFIELSKNQILKVFNEEKL
jgi:hypothetical protein